MASVIPTGKVRSRKEGAARPLEDIERRLLNLLQGSFPLEPRPFAAVAREAGLSEDEVLARTQALLDDRIIRQLTPIYDTRAFGYGSMLVAAKVDPEHPWGPARIVNSHPGVSHNYLRNHEFNMWFTLAVEEDSKLGLQGTLDVLQELTGAESIRQLPTLKLFKIRMDLEMEGGTDKLTAPAGEAVEPMDLGKQPYDERDVAVVRATQGDMPVVPEPYAPAAAELGMTQEQLLEHMAGMRERGLLRRVAAILFHRRAGFSATGWASGRSPRIGSPSSGRGWPRSAASATATSARPTRTGTTRSSPWRTGGRRGVRRRPRRHRGRDGLHRGPRDAVLLDRVQEDPPAVLHRRLQELGSAARVSGPPDARSAELYARAVRSLPGGVNSPVRAMRAIGRDPLFVASAAGAELTDVDGNVYVDWMCSWGPLILGHADPEVDGGPSLRRRRGARRSAPPPPARSI